MQEINSVVLTCVVLGIKPLRYTPAAVPVIEGIVAHHSRQPMEGGVKQVQFELQVRFSGDLAHQAQALGVGDWIKLLGFLQSKGRSGKQLMLVVQHYEKLNDACSDDVVMLA